MVKTRPRHLGRRRRREKGEQVSMLAVLLTEVDLVTMFPIHFFVTSAKNA